MFSASFLLKLVSLKSQWIFQWAQFLLMSYSQKSFISYHKLKSISKIIKCSSFYLSLYSSSENHYRYSILKFCMERKQYFWTIDACVKNDDWIDISVNTQSNFCFNRLKELLCSNKYGIAFENSYWHSFFSFPFH